MSSSHQFHTTPIHASNCIEDMDALLNHIEEFSELLHNQNNVKDDSFQEEWGLFRTYIKWKVEELTEYSYITNSHTNKSQRLK